MQRGLGWVWKLTNSMRKEVLNFCQHCHQYITDIILGIFQDDGIYHAFFVPVLGENEQMCVPILESYVRTLGPFNDRRNVHYEYA